MNLKYIDNDLQIDLDNSTLLHENGEDDDYVALYRNDTHTPEGCCYYLEVHGDPMLVEDNPPDLLDCAEMLDMDLTKFLTTVESHFDAKTVLAQCGHRRSLQYQNRERRS